jgi:DTW domain-containing protein YfiP
LCALCVAVPNQVPVLVLQHPDEQHQAKGTVTLLRLSLAHCVVAVGETFESRQLVSLLQAGGRGTVLLYPDAAGGPPAPQVMPGYPPGGPQLVLLDATWRKSLKMLHANPGLQALPRWPLNPLAGGRYGGLRRARRPNQLSTLEACCHALAQAEQAPQRYAGLLQAFDRVVAAQLAQVPVPLRQNPEPP